MSCNRKDCFAWKDGECDILNDTEHCRFHKTKEQIETENWDMDRQLFKSIFGWYRVNSKKPMKRSIVPYHIDSSAMSYRWETDKEMKDRYKRMEREIKF